MSVEYHDDDSRCLSETYVREASMYGVAVSFVTGLYIQRERYQCLKDKF